MSKEEWKKQALKIGQHVASLWGAKVEDVEIASNGNIVVYADEYGDKFYTELTPKEWSEYARECGVC